VLVKNFTEAGIMSSPPDEKPRYKGLRSAGLLLSIPTLLIVSPLVGFFIGQALDRRWRTSPWLTIVGLGLGFAAAARETYLIYRRAQQEEEREGRR
jgi:F0F1-type ATP synthase assembly protein I